MTEYATSLGDAVGFYSTELLGKYNNRKAYGRKMVFNGFPEEQPEMKDSVQCHDWDLELGATREQKRALEFKGHPRENKFMFVLWNT